MRGERDDGAKGIYLLAAPRGAPNPPSFSFSLSIFIKMPARERKKEKARERRKERKRPARAKYENPYSREEKISVI